MKTCSEIMTASPTCCVPDDSVQQVAQLMRAEDVGSVPVVENQSTKRLVGIVTDRDLVLKVLAPGLNCQSTTVQEVMSRDLVTCRATDKVDKAFKAMADYQIRRIPIVNDRNEIVGIIAQADIATRVEEPKKTAEVVEEISQPDTANT
jgi:CBS domain-containing protein